MASDPILSLEHVSMKFGGLVAVNDLSFVAERGEITALIGPNGAGKTTVFNCITGFYKPTEGMMTLKRKNGESYLLERMADFVVTRQAKVARTFQNIRLFSGMTVLENLLVAQHNGLMKASGYTILGLLGFPTYKNAEKAFRGYGFSDRKGSEGLKILSGTNFADVGFEFDQSTGRIVALCAIDNLMKGAAGTAVQCMNLMMGYPETTALTFMGLHPI